ncbi:hypothetical protein [Legionella sp.]|uniref:hypothetical protein n=1 Tax=Legionella sp. TaxID=459 RepID=UPI003CBA270A
MIEANGLRYEQFGEVLRSKHFDFNPIITTLKNYIDNGDENANNSWLNVGLEQSNLPVHGINEYCRPDRSFEGTLAFNEPILPRVLTSIRLNLDNNRRINLNMESDNETLFPLVISNSSGLGVHFVLVRAGSITHSWRMRE